MRANMQKELNTIKTALEAAGCTVEEVDTNMYNVKCAIGDGFAGSYKGGYWGDCAITDDKLSVEFLLGDIYEEGEISCGEGFVHVNYVEGSGLAYTGELDKLVCERIAAATNNVVEATSSEQGMQGEDYISLDMYV
jgi:hypothetical protein